MTEHAFDPLALWRDMLSRWEAGVNELANNNMASPEFSRFMNQAMGMSVRMQHAMGEMMGRTLTAMNMPTRADLVAIGERLQGIEEQLVRLTAAMERLSPGSAAEARADPGPPRAKRPDAPRDGPSQVPPARAESAAMPAAAAKPARRTKGGKSARKRAKAS